MWPVTVGELAAHLRARCDPHLPALVERADCILRGSAWCSDPPRPDEVYFAYSLPRVDGHEVARAMLAGGIGLAVVDGAWLAGADLSPDERSRCLGVNDPFVSFGVFASLLRGRFTFPVVAVGGSSGKTTTKELVAACLAGDGSRVTRTPGNNNGWIGVPYTLTLRENAAAAPPSALVVEIGVDEPGAMKTHVAMARPDVALLSAVGAEHLRGLGDVARAIEEELVLFSRAETRRVWLLDEPALGARAAEEARAGDLLVGAAEIPGDPRAGVDRLRWTARPRGGLAHRVACTLHRHGEPSPRAELEVDVPLPGAHNARNAALAIGAALLLGRTPRSIAAGLATLQPLDADDGGRSRVEELPRGALLIDDAYNACPGSMAAALAMLGAPELGDRPRVALLGDMLDLGDHAATLHRELAPALARVPRLHARLQGDAMRALFDELATSDAEPPPFETLVHLRAGEPPDAMLDDELPWHDAPVILVKGSRGMALERLVARLRERYGAR